MTDKTKIHKDQTKKYSSLYVFEIMFCALFGLCVLITVLL